MTDTVCHVQGNVIATHINENGIELVTSLPRPTITNITVSNDVWTPIDDTAVLSNSSTTNIIVEGTNFTPGSVVMVQNKVAKETAYISPTQLHVRPPSLPRGSYNVKVLRPDLEEVVVPSGLTYSENVTWGITTGILQANFGVPFDFNLTAFSDSPITYSNTLPLPPETELDTMTGNVSGTIASVTQDTVYSFTLTATDEELQDASKLFFVQYTTLLVNSVEAADNAFAATGANAVNTTGDNVVVKGSGFVAGDVVQVDGVDTTTTFLSSNQLGAIVPPKSIGTYNVSVKRSVTANVFVANAITYSTPVTWDPTSSFFELNFGVPINISFSATSNSTVTYSADGLPPQTTLDVATGSVTGTITTVQADANYEVELVATDEELQSSTQTVTLNYIALVVTSVDVTNSSWVATGDTEVGTSGGDYIAVNGSGFLASDIVRIGTKQATTTYISSTKLGAVVPANAEGSYDVIVERSVKDYVTLSPGVTYVLNISLMHLQTADGSASTTSSSSTNYNTASWKPVQWDTIADAIGSPGTFNPSTFTWTSSITGGIVMMVNLAVIAQWSNNNGPRVSLITSIEKNGTVGFGSSRTGYMRRYVDGNLTATLSLYVMLDVNVGDEFRVMAKGSANLNSSIWLNDTSSGRLSHWTIVNNSDLYQTFTSTNNTTNISNSLLTNLPFNLAVSTSSSLVTLDGYNQFIVQQSGWYKIACNIVYTSTIGRQRVFVQLFKNGIGLPGVSNCGYIRNADEHLSSSMHMVFVDNFVQGDIVTVRSRQDGATGAAYLISQESSISFQKAIEDVPYVSYSSNDTRNFDTSVWTPVRWSSVRVTDQSIVSETSLTERTILKAGYYAIHVSIYYDAVGQRTNLISSILKNGSNLPVIANQGYSRAVETTKASTHLNYVVSLQENDVLEVVCKRETGLETGTVTIDPGQNGFSLWQIHLIG